MQRLTGPPPPCRGPTTCRPPLTSPRALPAIGPRAAATRAPCGLLRCRGQQHVAPLAAHNHVPPSAPPRPRPTVRRHTHALPVRAAGQQHATPTAAHGHVPPSYPRPPPATRAVQSAALQEGSTSPPWRHTTTCRPPPTPAPGPRPPPCARRLPARQQYVALGRGNGHPRGALGVAVQEARTRPWGRDKGGLLVYGACVWCWGNERYPEWELGATPPCPHTLHPPPATPRRLRF